MKHKDLRNSYISAFCKELSMLFDAGVAPADGLLMLIDDEPGEDGKAVMREVVSSLDSGSTFCEALKKPGYFPGYMTSMLEIGEKTGHMSATLRGLAEYYERQDRISLSVRNAVTYPAILLIMMAAAVVILITRVMPIFNDTFRRLGVRMNPLASGIMNFGAWLESVSGVLMVLLAAILALALVLWLIRPARAALAAKIKRRFGHVGILGEIADTRFISAMALTTVSGLDPEEALSLAASVSGGAKNVDRAHAKCLETLRSGGTLSDAMYGAALISARDNRMMALGLKSGMSDAAMSEIAARREQDLQDNIDRLVSRIEPTLVIISSILVGLILLSVMLPLMGIMTSLES